MSFDRRYRLLGIVALAFAANAFTNLPGLPDFSTTILIAADDAPRTWTDASGKFKIEAELVSNDGDQVKLRKKDKRVVTLPVAKLSKEDQDYLAALDENPFAGGTLEENAADVSDAKTSEKGALAASGFAVGGSIVDFPTLSNSVHVGDRSKIKALAPASDAAWTLKPTPFAAREFASRRAVNLYEDERVGKSYEARDPAVLAPWSGAESGYFYITYNTGSLKDSKSFIERCDPEKGTSEIAQADGGELRFADVSADGKYALAIVGVQPKNGGFAEKTVLGVYELNDFGPNATTRPAAYFCPYYAKPKRDYQKNAKPIEQAAWIDSERALTRSNEEVTLWNLTTGEPEFAITSGIGAKFVLEPSRQYFALVTRGSVGFYDAKTGDALGALDLAAVKGDKEHALLGPSCAFSPDGLRFAVLMGNNLATFDLTTGKCEHSFAVDAALGELTWANGESILNGAQLYDLATGLPVCRYANLPLGANAAVNYGGLVWTIVSQGLDQVQFFGVQLPHQKAVDALKKLDMKEDFAVYPGASVAIKVETNNLLDEKEVTAALEERAKECGFTIDPNAKLTLFAKCSVDREDEVDYGTTATIGRLPIALPGQTRTLGSVKLKIFALQVAFLSDNKTVWDFGVETVGPKGVKYDPDKKIEDSIRETNKPDAKFYRSAPLPRYVAKGGRSSQMFAEIGPDGVK